MKKQIVSIIRNDETPVSFRFLLAANVVGVLAAGAIAVTIGYLFT